jgi:hypothetical protein
MPSYIEQYDRMNRWYQKCVTLNQGRVHDMPSENYVDEIFAFFQNAYHLKDWIKNDVAVPAAIKAVVESHVTQDKSLSLCADICNSLKHLVIDRPRSREGPAFGGKNFGLSIGAGRTTVSIKYEIVTNTGRIDAFELATDCVKAWKDFCKSSGI